MKNHLKNKSYQHFDIFPQYMFHVKHTKILLFIKIEASHQKTICFSKIIIKNEFHHLYQSKTHTEPFKKAKVEENKHNLYVQEHVYCQKPRLMLLKTQNQEKRHILHQI